MNPREHIPLLAAKSFNSICHTTTWSKILYIPDSLVLNYLTYVLNS